jgi:hypothetical protein
MKLKLEHVLSKVPDFLGEGHIDDMKLKVDDIKILYCNNFTLAAQKNVKSRVQKIDIFQTNLSPPPISCNSLWD